MRFPSTSASLGLLAATTIPLASAFRIIQSFSLNPCQANDGFTASLFEISFFPDNGTLAYNVNGISTINGKITANVQVFAYGYLAYNATINPCESDALQSLCPMTPGPIPIHSNSQIPKSAYAQVPGIAYGVPDLDGLVRIYVHNAATQEQVACVEAELSNSHTVDQKAVQWSTAVIAGIGLLASAVTSGLGHSNTAAHVAANALSLFGFFQAQAIIGMSSADLPPIVQAWTQDFQWSMGLISIGFVQDICTWYQRATGGTPSTLLSNLGVTSVELQKRALDFLDTTVRRFVKRQSPASSGTTVTVLKGIKRVGFRSNIEPTNIFLTGLAFFVAFIVAVAVGVALFKAGCEAAVRAGWLKSDKFQEFRNGWKIVLKGILFRIVLIGYPQMSILCLWEIVERDSAAEVVLGLFYFIIMTLALIWAAFKVIRIAQRSVSMHKNPAYILYSDPKALNKWGFLYVQFRATAYYFILPVLGYLLAKAIFIAFAQGAPKVQAVGLLIIEAGFLVTVSILKPWMDRKTNIFNIAIAVVNFLNAVFLLVFTNIFNQPGIVTGVMGVVFFVYNAAFAFVLLLMVFFASIYAIVSKNPDTRYQPMRDDRGSFIKSQTQLTTELDALGATARGDPRLGYKLRDLDGDDDSMSSGSFSKRNLHGDPAGVPLPPSTAGSGRLNEKYGDVHASPVDASTPFIPANGPPRHQSPGFYAQESHYSGSGVLTPASNRSGPRSFGGGPYDRNDSLQSSRTNTLQSNTAHRPPQMQQGPPAWQRGAGYDH